MRKADRHGRALDAGVGLDRPRLLTGLSHHIATGGSQQIRALRPPGCVRMRFLGKGAEAPGLKRTPMIPGPPRITIDPSICHGKPCIRGLRYPVENVLEWLAAGMDIEDILADYPDLDREDILSVLDFAARLAHTKRIDMLAA